MVVHFRISINNQGDFMVVHKDPVVCAGYFIYFIQENRIHFVVEPAATYTGNDIPNQEFAPYVPVIEQGFNIFVSHVLLRIIYKNIT